MTNAAPAPAVAEGINPKSIGGIGMKASGGGRSTAFAATPNSATALALIGAYVHELAALGGPSPKVIYNALVKAEGFVKPSTAPARPGAAAPSAPATAAAFEKGVTAVVVSTGEGDFDGVYFGRSRDGGTIRVQFTDAAGPFTADYPAASVKAKVAKAKATRPAAAAPAKAAPPPAAANSGYQIGGSYNLKADDGKTYACKLVALDGENATLDFGDGKPVAGYHISSLKRKAGRPPATAVTVQTPAEAEAEFVDGTDDEFLE